MHDVTLTINQALEQPSARTTKLYGEEPSPDKLFLDLAPSNYGLAMSNSQSIHCRGKRGPGVNDSCEHECMQKCCHGTPRRRASVLAGIGPDRSTASDESCSKHNLLNSKFASDLQCIRPRKGETEGRVFWSSLWVLHLSPHVKLVAY